MYVPIYPVTQSDRRKKNKTINLNIKIRYFEITRLEVYKGKI